MTWDKVVHRKLDTDCPDLKGRYRLEKTLVLNVSSFIDPEFIYRGEEILKYMEDEQDFMLIKDAMTVFMEHNYDFVRQIFKDDERRRFYD